MRRTASSLALLAAALCCLPVPTHSSSFLGFETTRPHGYLRSASNAAGSSSSSSFLRGLMYDNGEPAAPQPHPTLEEQRHGAKMFDNGEPPAPEPRPVVGGGRVKEEEPLFEGGEPPAPETVDPLAATRHAGKMFDNGEPAAPEPLPLPLLHQEQERMFDTGEPVAPEPLPPQPTTPQPTLPSTTQSTLPPPTDVVDVSGPQRIYDNGEPPASQPLPPQQQQQQQRMFDNGEPVAPEPLPAQPILPPTGGPQRMYDNGEPSAPQPLPSQQQLQQAQRMFDTGEPVAPEPLPASPAPSAPPAPFHRRNMMYDNGEPSAPQPLPPAEEQERHNSSPSQTFEYRFMQEEGEKEKRLHSPYPAPVDQEEGDGPFEERERVLAGVAGVPVCAPSFVWTSEAGELRANGQPFHLKGVNWFGFEARERIPFGLDAHSMDYYLQFLKDNQFNALRIPISVDFALDPEGRVEAEVVDAPLISQTNFQRLSTLVDRAGEFGLLVMLDMHRLSPDEEITPLWYDDLHTYESYLKAWDNVMKVFAGKWNVFALDLKNEPHGVATWGASDPSTDWNSAAEAIAKHLIKTYPLFTGLFFIEGIDNPTSFAINTGSGSTGEKNQLDTHSKPWGGDLEGVRSVPIDLGKAELNARVVYSPHVYGPSVFDREYFKTSDFPENLPAVWEAQWAFVEKATNRAVVLGEWGGKYDLDGPVGDRDRIWQDSLGDFLVENCLEDTFVWCLNPNSGDTGGLLLDDWTTPNTDKLALLARVQPTPSTVGKQGDESVCVVSGAYANPMCAPPV